MVSVKKKNGPFPTGKISILTVLCFGIIKKGLSILSFRN
jgi:hypothetical protein